MRTFRHLATASLLIAALAGCGDDTPEPTAERRIHENWHYASQEVGRLVLAGDPGGLGWLSEAQLKNLDRNDPAQMGVAADRARKSMVGTLLLYAGGTFHLQLAGATEATAVWRKVLAEGTWRRDAEDVGVLHLSITGRDAEGAELLEIPDTLRARRDGPLLLLDALNRTIPFERQFAPGR